MPRRFAPRLFLTISQKVKIGGVFWLKSELFLTKILTLTFDCRPTGDNPAHGSEKSADAETAKASKNFTIKRASHLNFFQLKRNKFLLALLPC